MSDIEKQLKKEVEDYNELVSQMESLDKERLGRLGRIEVLSEMASKNTAEPDPPKEDKTKS